MDVHRSQKGLWILLISITLVPLVSVGVVGAKLAGASHSNCPLCAARLPHLVSNDHTPLEPYPAATDFLLRQPATSYSHSSPMTLLSNSEMTHTVHIPLSVRGYCLKARSPFGIEIDKLDLFPEFLASEAELAWYEAEVFPDLLEAFKESGANWTRIMIRWRQLEPQDKDPEEYAGWAHYDEKLASVAETGAETIVVIGANPDWASTTLDGPIDIAPIEEFTEMLTAVVNRYRDPPYNVKHWELYNEADNVVAWGYYGAEYADMLEEAYPAIKAADPLALVLMGSIAYDWFTEYGGPFYRYFLDDVLANGGGDYFDVMNFHYFPDFHAEWDEQYNYQYGIDLIAKSNYIKERLGMYGVTKPLMCTELAEHGYAGENLSLQRQANYVVQGYTRGMSVGLKSIVWYALMTYDEHEQGLLYDDLEPKPAYSAYQILVRELAGATYVREFVSSDPSVEGYVFRPPCGEEKTALWASSVTTEGFPVVDQLRVVNRNGVESLIVDGGSGDLDGIRNGQVAIAVGTRPIYVQPDP